MFCENSHVRISAGGKWERGATNPKGKSLSPNDQLAIDVFRNGYWLSTKTGAEIPKAVELSTNAVNTGKNLNEIQTWANQKYEESGATPIHPPKVASVDVYKKSESLNNLEISNSSDGEGQELEGTVHTVELKVQFGENVYSILHCLRHRRSRLRYKRQAANSKAYPLHSSSFFQKVLRLFGASYLGLF